jgi:serine/threonine protein kinase
MKDVASGIAEMHANNIYHRDLKLENILVKETEEGGQRKVKAKVADFGFSTSTLADETVARGNKAHWPPEVFRAGKEHGGYLQGAAADVWAIGIMLYQLFYIDDRKHTNMPFVRSMLQNYDITDPQIRFSLSNLAEIDNQGNDLRPIKALMLRCLQYSPSQRITARQVAEELGRIPLN